MHFFIFLLLLLYISHSKLKINKNRSLFSNNQPDHNKKLKEIDNLEKLEVKIKNDLNFKVGKYNSCRKNSLICGIRYERRKKITTKFTPHEYFLPFPIKLRIITEPKSKCKDNMKLIIALMCSPGQFSNRYVYRKIYSKYKFIKLYFFTTRSDIKRINDLIKEENDKYDDIIQYDFKGGYYLITYQVAGAIRYINENCKNYKYLIDHQSDIFLNIPFYLKMFEKDTTYPIIGNLYLRPLVCRSKNFVSYMPKDLYKDDYYPPFVQGACIFFSEETVKKLAIASYSVDRVICFDDVYIGFLMNYSKIDVKKTKCIEKYKRNEYSRRMSKSFIRNDLLWIHGFHPAAIYYLSMN